MSGAVVPESHRPWQARPWRNPIEIWSCPNQETITEAPRLINAEPTGESAEV